MKRIVSILLFSIACIFIAPVAFIGCKTAPTQRTTEVKTLKIIGASIDSSMKIAADLFKTGKITQDQWNQIAALHDGKIQPAYNLAVAAVRSDLSNIAAPDIVGLALQLAELVSSFKK